MSELILVRHGQANRHATDEAGYDRLSRLGAQQAEWLGAHFAQTNPHFDHVITGTLHRQTGTATNMGYTITERDDRLNELSYFAIAKSAETLHGIPAPVDANEYARYLPQVMGHWARGELADVPETFEQFTTRITGLVDEARHLPGRKLIVTSGGVIGLVMRHTLGLDIPSMSKVMLQVMNSSLHRMDHAHDTLMLGTFNATPHLDLPDRAHARTFI
ncbi:histidine phosphatase family protein [Roseovarius sp. D22-M7]|uniref:histidine phosphatase family protein n=1 Tax=Roseovarius sp. D22-M7 TaxID=3127116 RepID=UPI00301057F1